MTKTEIQESQVIERAISKTKEVHLKLCAALADLEATGVITKDSEAGGHLREARAGADILQKILTGEITTGPPYGLQNPSR